MTYLVAYDIRSGLRLRRVAKLCLRFGTRVGLSVFEMNLKNENDYYDFLKQLAKQIDTEHDLVRIYRICENCLEKRLILGKSRGELKILKEGEAYIF